MRCERERKMFRGNACRRFGEQGGSTSGLVLQDATWANVARRVAE